MVAKLKMVCAECCILLCGKFEVPKDVDLIVAVHTWIETLNTQEQLDCLSNTVKTKYVDVFSPIPHIDDLPTDVYCRIQLKDATKTFATRSYSTPHKYKKAWAT